VGNADVASLAALGSGDGLDAFRPPPPRLEREPRGGRRADAHHIHLRLVRRPRLIRRIEVACLHTGHGSLLSSLDVRSSRSRGRTASAVAGVARRRLKCVLWSAVSRIPLAVPGRADRTTKRARESRLAVFSEPRTVLDRATPGVLGARSRDACLGHFGSADRSRTIGLWTPASQCKQAPRHRVRHARLGRRASTFTRSLPAFASPGRSGSPCDHVADARSSSRTGV
jgi:hypothetical protein